MRNRFVVIAFLPIVLTAAGAAGERLASDRHAEGSYGKQLPLVGKLGVGPSMDAAIEDNTLYVIGRGVLYVADVSDPASPRVAGRLAGLGHVRQICVAGRIAYVTAREDGMFLVDVKRPEEPALLSHYDTVELATGIAVSGDVAFVACRTAGVELVDVSDPTRPVHLSTVRTGEAQSVVARDGILYAGVWGTLELVMCDVSNPRRPSVIARAPLDGYGDGVDVRGKYCYVATGHHSRTSPRRQEGDPGHGRGHGLEIFDVSDPANPAFVSRIKMPRFYRLGMDMWEVIVAGRYAFVADTYNGVFVVDVSRPREPCFVGCRQLPRPAGRDDPSPVGGIAIGDDHVYAAGAWSGLHVIEAANLATRVQPELDRAPTIPPPERLAPDPRFRVYRPDGQVYAAGFAEETALVAAGAAGLHAVRLWPEIEKIAEYETEGFAMDVKLLGDRVYTAEGTGGLSIWKRNGAAMARIGRYAVPGQSVKQVIVPPPGKYALVHVGPAALHVVDVSDASNPTRVLKDSRLGLLYYFPMADGLLEGRYACCHWHVSGLYWYDLYGGPKPVYTGDNYPFRIGSRGGVAYRDHDALATYRGKYFILRRGETRSPDELPLFGVPGQAISGKPSIFDNTLYASDRYAGTVTAVDITKIDQPRLLGHLQLEEHPGLVVVCRGMPVIPAGYQGLLVWNLTR